MSEDENTGPAIPRFSEMFRFADDSDLNEHARELRAEAFAYGFNLDVRVFPGPIPPPTEAELGEGITPLPKRAREILHELNTKHYLNECEVVNAERHRRGQKPFGDAKKLAKFQADFEKAYYGKFRHSQKARRIVDLVRAWHGRQITEQWNKPEDQWENRIRLVLLSPVLNAARENVDTDFFKLLAGAVQMLSNRIYSSKDKTIGATPSAISGCSNTQSVSRGRLRTLRTKSTYYSIQPFPRTLVRVRVHAETLSPSAIVQPITALMVLALVVALPLLVLALPLLVVALPLLVVALPLLVPALTLLLLALTLLVLALPLLVVALPLLVWALTLLVVALTLLLLPLGR